MNEDEEICENCGDYCPTNIEEGYCNYHNQYVSWNDSCDEFDD